MPVRPELEKPNPKMSSLTLSYMSAPLEPSQQSVDRTGDCLIFFTFFAGQLESISDQCALPSSRPLRQTLHTYKEYTRPPCTLQAHTLTHIPPAQVVPESLAPTFTTCTQTSIFKILNVQPFTTFGLIFLVENHFRGIKQRVGFGQNL